MTLLFCLRRSAKAFAGRFGWLAHLSLVLQARDRSAWGPAGPQADQASRGGSGTQPVTFVQPVKAGDGPGDPGQVPVLR